MRITVVGSINVDMVATAPSLPRAGETVTGAVLARHPGGKGANQALAALRLGAEVALIGAVGEGPLSDEALVLLEEAGVDLTGVGSADGTPTGVALIAVDPSGENQIVVAPGANDQVRPEHLPARIDDPLIVQLELPVETVEAAVGRATGFVCANLAPARPVSEALLRRCDLIVVNETEAAFYGDALHSGGGQVVITRGAEGASLYKRGAVVAEVGAPLVEAVDATGAGDAFVGAITVALLEGQAVEAALRFACAAGALAATVAGAQPSLPTREQVEALLKLRMVW
ncbi:MAG: ribokinase [Brevundimonas sp.]|uniref:ribokinase n=1 Tax=Brevundimonas sp. TaxID=1871086 RepID=UPI0027738DF9|nr:ribokinase [Brevundimonas sp.]MDP3401744.1 ribokinase [Brevundimonas sp.]MDZ4113975.1 ribokinase [Brevundimonas sp.]